MTDINILALFGIEITELEIYEQTDSGDGWVAFRIRKSKAFTPCPACGSVECRTNDYRRKPYRFRSQTGIEAPGFGEAEQLPLRGIQQQGEDVEEGVLRPIQLRAPQEADIPHLRQKRPQEKLENLK